jgi:hypothetical protein
MSVKSKLFVVELIKISFTQSPDTIRKDKKIFLEVLKFPSLIIEGNAETNLSTGQYLSQEPISSEENAYYEECKQYYYMTERPLISVSDEIFDNNVEQTAQIFKFGIDEDCNQFNLQEFLNKVCGILNINKTDITIKKIQNGSAILEAEINDKLESKSIKLKLKMIYESLTDKLQEELGKLKVFFMFMGPVKSFFKMQKYRTDIKLHPQYNRVYCQGQAYWNGANDDGKDRGNQPYYCPIGWKRYSFYVTDNFDEKFKGWCIGYHGTKFSFGLSILLSGLKPAERAEHGSGIYATPSINYACHPRYSEVKLIESTHQKNFFKNGKYVQFVLECRVHPSNIKTIAKETLAADNTKIDSNIDNDIIEWVIDNKKKALVDFNDPDSPVICTGLMTRVTDNHPGLLPESQWWYNAHLCGNKECCWLGSDLNKLQNQNNNGDKCNLIYE